MRDRHSHRWKSDAADSSRNDYELNFLSALRQLTLLRTPVRTLRQHQLIKPICLRLRSRHSVGELRFHFVFEPVKRNDYLSLAGRATINLTGIEIKANSGFSDVPAW